MTDESLDDSDAIGDPFDQLDEDAPEEDTPTEGPLFGEARTETGESDPDTTDADAASGSRSAARTDRSEVDDPFDELGPATGEGDAALDEVFERMDVGDLSEEDVWKSIDEGAGGGPVGAFGSTVSEADSTGSGLGGRLGAGDTSVERVISKRTYCQQCPHFSAPPEVACGHEGTTILEAVGFDEFRVRNCPMVDADDPTLDAAREE
ncbi:hypothetical protein [Halorubrum sp. N11]|uniref:hypothetical protein n=1 Tax=Halorubrum sp. N11 TaxID=3402276 RepID=UPI003EBE417F